MTFNHENLEVYQRALAFSTRVSDFTSAWDNKHSIQDHLTRASGSIVENIAMGSATYSGMKAKSLDYAVGSTLECAACLDLASIKQLLDETAVITEKEDLCQLLKKLIGLRRSWVGKQVREDREEYSGDTETLNCPKASDENINVGTKLLFHHETLDLYRVSLQAFTLLTSLVEFVHFPVAQFRRLDTLATSIVLNIAEGNGRFSVLEHSRFLNISHEATVKLAARLDLCVAQGLLSLDKVKQLKDLLLRITSMTLVMMKKAEP